MAPFQCLMKDQTCFDQESCKRYVRILNPTDLYLNSFDMSEQYRNASVMFCARIYKKTLPL